MQQPLPAREGLHCPGAGGRGAGGEGGRVEWREKRGELFGIGQNGLDGKEGLVKDGEGADEGRRAGARIAGKSTVWNEGKGQVKEGPAGARGRKCAQKTHVRRIS